MRRLLVPGLLALTMSALPAAPTAAAPAPAPCGGFEVVQLRTIHIETKLDKKSYRVGDTVIFKMTLTRPAREDPLGQGIPVDPPTTRPAEGVSIGVGLVVEDVYLWGLGTTDQGGKATIRVKLKNYTPEGMAHARAFGKKNVLDTPCLVVDEIGYRPMPNAFRVKR